MFKYINLSINTIMEISYFFILLNLRFCFFFKAHKNTVTIHIVTAYIHCIYTYMDIYR